MDGLVVFNNKKKPFVVVLNYAILHMRDNLFFWLSYCNRQLQIDKWSNTSTTRKKAKFS